MLIYEDITGPDFCRKVEKIAKRLGTDPNYLMACMHFETGGTFSPSVRNPGSSATGLIQFMRTTALHLGTTVEALAAMSAVEQLDYVERYFKRFKGRLAKLEDVYMVILWPVAVGRPDDYVLFDRDRNPHAYKVNAGLDLNKDGKITKWEAASKVRKRYERGIANLPEPA